MRHRVLRPTVPCPGGAPVSRSVRLAVAHLGDLLCRELVEDGTGPRADWIGGSKSSPTVRRPGSDPWRAPVILGELLVEEGRLQAAGVDVGSAACLRFECARYEQFEDEDSTRARGVVDACRELVTRLTPFDARPFDRILGLLTAAARRPGWTSACSAELERLGPRRTATPPPAPTPVPAEPQAPVAPGPVPGQVVAGVPRGDRARVTVMGDIFRLRTEQTLQEQRGHEVSVSVLRRLREVRADGRFWVDERGVVTTCQGDRTVHVTVLAAEEWFSGVISVPILRAPVPRTAPARSTAAEVRAWARSRRRPVARGGALSPRLVREYDLAHPSRPYGGGHPVRTSMASAPG